jgi:hypothetical protein
MPELIDIACAGVSLNPKWVSKIIQKHVISKQRMQIEEVQTIWSSTCRFAQPQWSTNMDPAQYVASTPSAWQNAASRNPHDFSVDQLIALDLSHLLDESEPFFTVDRWEKMVEKGADDVLLTLMSGSRSTIENLQFAQTPPPIHSGLVPVASQTNDGGPTSSELELAMFIYLGPCVRPDQFRLSDAGYSYTDRSNVPTTAAVDWFFSSHRYRFNAIPKHWNQNRCLFMLHNDSCFIRSNKGSWFTMVGVTVNVIFSAGSGVILDGYQNPDTDTANFICTDALSMPAGPIWTDNLAERIDSILRLNLPTFQTAGSSTAPADMLQFSTMLPKLQGNLQASNALADTNIVFVPLFEYQFGQSELTAVFPATTKVFKLVDREAPNLHTIVVKTEQWRHPARTADFERMYADIQACVAIGKVEKTVDEPTGLEIYCYLQSNFDGSCADWCRGLVLCPKNREVVASPFVRFQPPVREAAKTGSLSCDQACIATLKLDGSLAIVFMWQGKLHVSTRRRMTSEQAVWAKQWLLLHSEVSAFKVGWTYLFEVISAENVIATSYRTEGLVLLAIIDEKGYEIARDVQKVVASEVKVRIVPHFEGNVKDFYNFKNDWSGIDGWERLQRDGDDRNPYFHLPCVEGWIIQSDDGMRHKCITDAWRRSYAAAKQCHPAHVWQEFCAGRSLKLLKNFPIELHREMSRIMFAVAAKFAEYLALSGGKDIAKYLKSERISRFVKKGRLWPEYFERLETELSEKEYPDIHIVLHQGTESFDPQNRRLWVDGCGWCPWSLESHMLDRYSVLDALAMVRPSKPFAQITHYSGPSRRFAQNFCKGWDAFEYPSVWAAFGPTIETPFEIVKLIFSKLDGLSLARARATCKCFLGVINLHFADAVATAKQTVITQQHYTDSSSRRRRRRRSIYGDSDYYGQYGSN